MGVAGKVLFIPPVDLDHQPGIDRVVIGQRADSFDHRVRDIRLEARGGGNFGRCGFGNATDIHLGTASARTFSDGVRHLLEMAVGRVIEHENLGHGTFPFG